MKTIISLLRFCFPVFVLVLGITLIFASVPISLIQVFLALDYVIALYLFFTRIIRKQFPKYFPQLIVHFSILTCGLAIATTRTFLSIKTLEEQIPIVRIIGGWICRDNYVCGFFTTLINIAFIFTFCKLYTGHTTRVARFESVDHLRNLDDKRQFYASWAASSEFLLGTFQALIVLFVIAVGGGVAVGILDCGMQWHEALNQYIMLSSGYLALFIIPMFLAALSSGKPEVTD